jgi:hypothetical protein
MYATSAAISTLPSPRPTLTQARETLDAEITLLNAPGRKGVGRVMIEYTDKDCPFNDNDGFFFRLHLVEVNRGLSV